MGAQRRLKKLRQLMVKNIRTEMTNNLKEILKPKPKFMPKCLWKFLISWLLNIQEK